MVSATDLRNLYWGEGLGTPTVAKRLGYSRWYIRHLLEKYGIPTRPRRDSYNPTNPLTHHTLCLPSRTSPFTYWLLGWVLSDGHLGLRNHTLQVNLNPRDEDVLKLICKGLNASHTPKTTKLRSQLTICSSALISYLGELISEGIPAIPDNLLPHFLRGFFEGDGGIGRYGNEAELSFWNADLGILRAINERLCYSGVVDKGHIADKMHNRSWRLRFTRNIDVIALARYMYLHTYGYHLARKHHKVKEVCYGY